MMAIANMSTKILMTNVHADMNENMVVSVKRMAKIDVTIEILRPHPLPSEIPIIDNTPKRMMSPAPTSCIPRSNRITFTMVVLADGMAPL